MPRLNRTPWYNTKADRLLARGSVVAQIVQVTTLALGEPEDTVTLKITRQEAIQGVIFLTFTRAILEYCDFSEEDITFRYNHLRKERLGLYMPKKWEGEILLF